jgi:hypothetical protein
MKRLILLALMVTSALANAGRIEIDSDALHDCQGNVVLYTSCDENTGTRYYQMSITAEKCKNYKIQRNGSNQDLSSTTKLRGDQPPYSNNNIQLNREQSDALVNNGLNIYVHSNSKKTADGAKVTVPGQYRPETCEKKSRPTPPPSSGEEY